MTERDANPPPIPPARHADPVAVQRHLDALTKPVGSLGRLERSALRLARIYGDPPRELRERVVIVCAADHGVARHGVSAYPSSVTGQMCRNIAAGGAAISVLARSVGARIVLLDVGVDADLDDLPGIRHRKVRRGSRDLATGPALTREEVLAAIAAGADAVATCHPMPDIVALGEVGIGNTTVASAVAGVLTGADPSEVVGRGTGVSDVGLARKRAIVDRAMARLHPSSSATDILKEVGGLDVAALVGVCLSAPRRGCAVVLDGFVSTAAAALAARMDGNACDYYIAGHLAPEPGHRLLLELLSLEPLLSMDMRLGEGTGAVLALPLLDAAGALLRDMATFAEAGVEGPTGGPDAH